MKRSDIVFGIVAVVLLLILAALVGNRALAVNEPPEFIIPQAPPHAASGLLIAPVPPETSVYTPNTYPSQQDALNTAMEAIPDELVAEAALLAWGEYSGSDYAQRTAPIWCACNRAESQTRPDYSALDVRAPREKGNVSLAQRTSSACANQRRERLHENVA